MSNSWTITDPDSTVELADEPPTRPPHPGRILQLVFMEPLVLTPEKVAEALGAPTAAVLDLIEGRASMTPELALRLAHAFSTDAGFWMRLQAHHDLEMARRFGHVNVDHLPVLHAAE